MSAVGGICAYVADILGYKIGKKRISFKRIRPKYIARISVVVAGMLIPLVTIALIYAVSADFRTWLTKGQQFVRELQEKSEQLNGLNDTLVKKETQNAELTNKNHLYDADLKKKQDQVKEQEKKIQEQKDKLASLEASSRQLRDQFESAKTRLSEAKGQLEAKQKQLQAVTDNYASAKSKYDIAKQSYDEISKRNLELTSQNSKLTNDNADLATKAKQLQTTLTDLQAQMGGLNKEIESLKKDKEDAQQEAATAQTDVARYSKDLENLRTRIESARALLTKSLEVVRQTTINFLNGEEIARMPIDHEISTREATNAFRSLMRTARSVATERGSTTDITYPFYSQAGFEIPDKTGQNYLNADQVEKYWVDRFVRVPDNQVAVLTASGNRFVGEPLSLQMQLYPNPIVFRKGEIISDYRLDARNSDSDIRSSIREFLRTFVNTRARSRKMIPVVSRDGESFGQFSEDQFFEAFARAKTIHRLVRIVAVAHDDIRAGDPLAIDLEFR